MQIKVTNHAIIRYYERFINSGNMNGDQIAEEIKLEFDTAQYDSSTEDDKQEFQFESPDIKIYKQVLDGTLAKFPIRFWEDDKGGNLQISARECTKYMYEEILKWNIAEIINKSNKEIFSKYKLIGMATVLFDGSWHMAVYNAYPNIKPYMIKSRGNFQAYWKDDEIEKAKEMGIWLKKELEKDGYKFSGRGRSIEFKVA